MRDMARAAVERSEPLPDAYYQIFGYWYVSGFPAFAAVLGILWLMIARPDISFS
jgi:uncharacterized membrane protein